MDQFYTRSKLARRYARQVVSRWPSALFIEPSAGAGAFVKALKGQRVRAIDIEPHHPKVRRADYLNTHILRDEQPIVVIGNPPFGKNSSMAVRFFNHAAQYAIAIAFIVPRTFRKASLQARLHPHYHLVHDEDVPAYGFKYQGQPYNVPCAWQIWIWSEDVRELPEVPDVRHLIKYTTRDKANCAIRRVGYYAGKVSTRRLEHLSASTHYFLRAKRRVVRKLRTINWSDVVTQTAGARSLSKAEIARRVVKL